MQNEPLYDADYIRSLFDEMAETYGLVNLISSFGFAVWWRRQCANFFKIKPNATILDLMTGMGELCTELTNHLEPGGSLVGLDISPVMCRHARLHSFKHHFDVIEADALVCPLEDSSVDCIFSSFGLKTFSQSQIVLLAAEVYRLLKPGGQFAFLEISVPPNRVLRTAYMFYLRSVIPIIGRLFLGNPDNYRMLGIYTTAFQNCRFTYKAFAEIGLQPRLASHFFGCATSVVGSKPKSD